MYGYIYLTENQVNGKKYIGQHHSEKFDSTYYGSGKVIRQALEKYGTENFSVNILEWCKDLQELNAREVYWIEHFNAVESEDFYNLVEGGKQWNPMLGKHHTPEAVEKCRLANLGRKPSEDARAKMSAKLAGSKNPRYGCKISDEQKEKQRESLKKFRERHPEMDKEHSKFMKEYYKTHEHPMQGKLHSEETKEKIRQKNLGRKVSEESRLKMSQAQKGKPKKSLRKSIMCVETGKIFSCSEEACNSMGFDLKNQQYLAKSARSYVTDSPKKALGYQWKYL